MNKRNYQKEMEQTILKLPEGAKPRLLLHSCCGPCSTAVLETLAPYFSITLFFSNSNIAPQAEYEKRKQTQLKLLDALPFSVDFLEDAYTLDAFLAIAQGLEQEPEGGARCPRCFALRLGRSAQVAKAQGFDFFTTTLTVSPHKDAETLNRIGQALGEQYGVPYLCSDFKKKEGYKRSVAMAKEFDLYRQDYCGCVFSLAQREREKAEQTHA